MTFLPPSLGSCHGNHGNPPVLEATLLYTSLEKQARLEECLQLLQSDTGSNMVADDLFKQTEIADLLYKLGNKEDCCSAYRQLVELRYCLTGNAAPSGGLQSS